MFEFLEAQRGGDNDEEKSAIRDLLLQTTHRAFVTPVLFALNLLYFVAMLIMGAPFFAPSGQQLIVLGANFGPYTLNGEWMRLFLSTFIHIGFVHLAFNMWCLWNLGRLAERIFGNWIFLAAYVSSGLAGSIASVWWNPTLVSAGASGAIFGVAGMLVAFFVLETRGVPSDAMEESRNSLLAFVGYNLFYGITTTGIDNAAHVGGLLMGLVMGACLRRPLGASRPRPSMRHGLILAAAPIVLIVGARSAQRASADVPLVIAGAGDLHLAASELDEAAESYRRSLELDPDLTYVHHSLGIVYLEKGLGNEAKASFEKTLELDPDNTFFLSSIGELYRLYGYNTEAIAVLERSVALDPDNADSHKNLGYARDAGGDEAGAAVAYERWRELTPLDPRAINAVAWLYATAEDPNVRDPEMALLLAKRAVELSEERVPSYLDTLAEAHYVNGHFDEAIKIETKAVAMDPENEFFKEQLSKYECAKEDAAPESNTPLTRFRSAHEECRENQSFES